MGKNVVVVNAGPRMGFNTDTLLRAAASGAEEAGAHIERFDLFRLARFTGCISCFGCKRKEHAGYCILRDALTPILDAIRMADALIIGSPNYLGDMTASFRALYERLIFQNLTYNVEWPCCNEHFLPVLLIMTCNAPEETYQGLVGNYQQTLERLIGPTKTLVCGETLQIEDYDRTDWEWSMFDASARKERHDRVFPQQCETARQMGASLIEG